MISEHFSGSYPASDVQFLLKPIDVTNTPVFEKELLIQSGAKHYAEMLSHESLPSKEYQDMFWEAVVQNKQLMARHLLMLATAIQKTRLNGIVLVSLARAGTPIGVLLKRVLAKHFSINAPHYSISIVRDIGLDENALFRILSKHTPESLVFVDGWTGKGVISKQLKVSLEQFEDKYDIHIRPDLYVLSDLSGTAAVAASCEDYLIPSSILNATVSGLISRSVVDKLQLSEKDYHGCHYYEDFLDHDVSNLFIDILTESVEVQAAMDSPYMQPDVLDKEFLQRQSKALLAWVNYNYRISNQNLIKPGIGESTRVLLRREANQLLIRDQNDPSIAHLIFLAKSKQIPISYLPQLPYRAVALIKERYS